MHGAPDHERTVAVAKELLAFLRDHADEIRAKALDYDRIVSELERAIEDSETGAERLRAAEREEKAAGAMAAMLRAETVRVAAGLGMPNDAASVDYLHKPPPPRRRGPDRPGQGG